MRKNRKTVNDLKKILAIMMIVTVSVSFAGCGKSDSENKNLEKETSIMSEQSEISDEEGTEQNESQNSTETKQENITENEEEDAAESESENVPESETENKESEEQQSNDYAAAYAELLGELQLSAYTGVNFELGYIDEDDIPELFVADTTVYRASSVSIYTYYDGKVVNMGEYGTFAGCMYSPKNKIVWTYNAYPEMEHNIYDSLSRGESSRLADLRITYNGATTMYELNDVEIAQEQYEEELKKYDTTAYTYVAAGGVFDYNDSNMETLRENPLEFLNPNEK